MVEAPQSTAVPGSPEETLSTAGSGREEGGPASASLQQRIYDWSKELDLWQRDLLRRLAHGPLAEEDEKEILAMLTGHSEAPRPEPMQLEDLPADEAEVGVVELRELRDVQNINHLAEGQELRFEPGLNVVFGLTGTGKSGYGRLLRQLCRAAERGEVLRNVFDPDLEEAPQRASLVVAVDGEDRQIDVDLDEGPDRLLSAMTAFDAECARASLAGAAVTEHVPRALLLFQQLARAQSALARRVRDRSKELLDALPPLPKIEATTEAGQLVAEVSAETDRADVERLATLDEEERAELEKLGIAVAAIESGQGRELERANRTRSRNAAILADEIEAAAEGLSDERLEAVASLRGRLDDATEAERSLAEDAFSEQLFPETGQRQWQLMWKAVQRFVEDEDGAFPGAGLEACPVCQQDLDDNAWARLEKFEEFVRGDLREQISDLTESLTREVDRLPDVAMVQARIEAASAEAPEEVSAVVESLVEALASREDLARRLAEGKDADPSSAAPLPDIASLVSFAGATAATVDAQAALHSEEERRRVTERLAELRAREALAAALPSVLEHIAGLRKAARLEEAKAKLQTTKISTDLRRLQQEVVTDQLDEALAEELERFDLVTRKVNVVSRVSKGDPVVRFWFKAAKMMVNDVLSDGEQRALALAFFLAESAVSDGRSAIVLDDPVELLDHKKRNYAARRLVEEAGHRQVIVFTHDLAFLDVLEEEAEESDRDLHCQTLQRDTHRAGIVIDGPPDATGSANHREEQLSHS